MPANVSSLNNGPSLSGATYTKKVGITNNDANNSSHAENSPRQYEQDGITISEDGSIDLALFNYLDKGGDASEALFKPADSGESFKPKPNFSGMGMSRYSQMKAEIERNFADSPELKDKYLRELEKTLDDYLNLQAKLADALASKKDGEMDEVERQQAEALKNATNVDSSEIKAIIEKVLGDKSSKLPEELSNAVDDYFIKIYKQKMGVAKKHDVFNKEVKEDPRIKEIWNSVRLRIDSDE